MKSRYLPVIVILVSGSLMWLKEIQSSFLWTCMHLLDALRSPTSSFERCMASAHRLLWTIRAVEIVVLVLVVSILRDKRCPWWVKTGTCIAWLAAVVYSLSPD